MRRKRLISPEKPVQDSIEYRSRLLFLPTFSYAIAIAISFAFLGGIFTLTQVKSAMAGIVGSIILLLVLLIIETLLAYILTKISDVILTLEGISGFNWWYRRTYTNWKQVTLIKPSNLLGIRYLSIKTTDGKSILLTTHFYKTVQMLDRVRELAGEEHILVRALEKELSRPRYELTKVWCWVIGSIALIISIYIIGGNMYAAEQEKPLEQAIASYVRQHPKTPPNRSAIELQALMTKLGLSVDAFGDGSNVKVKPEKAAIAEWKGIEPTFIKYLEKQKTQESIEPIPDRLSSYP